MPNATFLVVHGADQGTRIHLDGTPVGIGRGARNEIRILDTEVSRQHALVHYEDGAFQITDRNSSNGTFVNGEAIRTRRLVNGDRVQVGRTVMLFEQQSESEEGRRPVAEWVDLVGRQTEDRSSIVGQADRDSHLMIDATLPGAANHALAQMVANLQALYRIAEEAVSSSNSLDQLLRRILDLSIDVVGADRGCILLLDRERGEPVPHAYSQRRGQGDTARMPVSRSIIDYVMHQGQGVRTSDARRDQRFEPGQSILQAGIREAICVPMQGRYELLGVVYLDTTTLPERMIIDGEAAHQFDDEKLRLMVAIARQCALAIENHRYQEAYVKAERLAAMGQTIAMLSHHIKNILQGVRGGSYLIDMGLREHNEELVRKGWGIVEKNQGKIYNLVLDMLTFSKERKPVLAVADLNETVGEVCELMQARAAEYGIDLVYRPAEHLPLTTFDAEGIHRAVLNVVNNAIDAVEGVAGGKVLVETTYDTHADEMEVIVTDNGPGIRADQIERIFSVFESTKGARGTGLGLAVSRKIVREHGGEIRVESRPGEGSRFTIAWPRIDDEHRPPEPMTHA